MLYLGTINYNSFGSEMKVINEYKKYEFVIDIAIQDDFEF